MTKEVRVELIIGASDAARALAAHRKVFDGVCEMCGTPFTGVDARKRYCSHRCVVRAGRERKKLEGTA